MKKIITIVSLVAAAAPALAQQNADTLHRRWLDSVTIVSYLKTPPISRMEGIQGGFDFTGKKTESINLLATNADIANKTARQIFARVPGIFVYDMDGAGNQVNIASRGLDPHRGWDFNLRKDGVLINSDMYGYPASHYSMPMESIAGIAIVRGTGSLQYGAQLGGMINYVSKQGDTTRPFSFESINTAGSYNLLSTYNAVGGKIGKWKYYAYYQRKTRDGYRDNEHTNSEAQAISLTYTPVQNVSVRMEWARSMYRYRMPGPLTDSMFRANPRQASRARSYYSPDIHVPSITADWQVSPSTALRLTSSAVLGSRGSVMFDKPASVGDTIVAATLQYNNRQVDIDNYHSYTNELRIVQQYLAGRQHGSLVAGVQLMHNDLHRRQLGKGTTGSDYDLSLVSPGWGRDVHFKTKNLAVFAENSFALPGNLTVNAGFRVESGATDLGGTITYYPENEIPVRVSHHFPLFGASLSWKPASKMEVYGGWSQAYRPMLLKDLIPSSLFEKVDPDISDARGYNAELGVRGRWRFLQWDISLFALQYNNRFGTLSQTDANGDFYLYRTNIGNSLAKGLEFFVQGDWMLNRQTRLIAFTSTSVMDARYHDAVVKSGNENVDVDGNRVENAPSLISRNGITLKYRRAGVSVLYSYTAESFADALNTVVPTATGAVGKVPAYGLLDVNASARMTANLELRLNVNNVTNKQYFTKRPSFYPGPGVWPSDGRNLSASVVLKL